MVFAEVAGHGQAPYRGGRPWPGYLQGAVGCGQAPARGGHPRARLIAASPTATYVFLIYYWADVLVIICNYIERRSGSVEITAGPTMPWREITMHGDATI
ncbi:hypothetical protein B296_00055976 [Ensete ventricosum]|uniref:Uncharacterized protein n=1 Tax=Ensete ventricosum TaxID=4639 RepID=A0A426WZ35_ENSVE|nr:hypothetical protein B296_00055976 [Ensete ventricosum]